MQLKSFWDFIFSEQKQEWRKGIEEERERILSRLGAWSRDAGIMAWAEIKSLMFNQLSHSCAPV